MVRCFHGRFHGSRYTWGWCFEIPFKSGYLGSSKLGTPCCDSWMFLPAQTRPLFGPINHTHRTKSANRLGFHQVASLPPLSAEIDDDLRGQNRRDFKEQFGNKHHHSSVELCCAIAASCYGCVFATLEGKFLDPLGSRPANLKPRRMQRRLLLNMSPTTRVHDCGVCPLPPTCISLLRSVAFCFS